MQCQMNQGIDFINPKANYFHLKHQCANLFNMNLSFKPCIIHADLFLFQYDE